MKTIDQLKRRRSEIEGMSREQVKALSKRETSKLEKEMTNLIYCIQYLETSPRQEFVESELIRVEKEIARIATDEYYKQWINGNKDRHASLKDPRKAYENEMELPKLKQQLKTLKFILS